MITDSCDGELDVDQGRFGRNIYFSSREENARNVLLRVIKEHEDPFEEDNYISSFKKISINSLTYRTESMKTDRVIPTLLKIRETETCGSPTR